MNRPNDYDALNADWILRCRQMAGIQRLLQAVREGPPDEDPVRLEVEEGEGQQSKAHPPLKVPTHLRIFDPNDEE